MRGEVRVPGDKSISHRALIFGALADGASTVAGILRSADIESTAGVLRALGVDVPELSERVVLHGVGRRGLRPPAGTLDCGNSGTTARLMAGVLAGHPFASRMSGDASLSRRPMRRVAAPLERMGARLALGPTGGLPATIEGGALRPIDYDSPVASAQVKSAVLLAGLVGGVPVSVTEPSPSRDHTERMLRARGVPVERAGATVRLAEPRELSGAEVQVPADPSSAAFFAALAALATGGELHLLRVCLNPTRTGFLDVLRRMGARVETEASDEGGEPVGTVVVAPDALRAVDVGPSEVPSLIDELPLVACLAARAEGETVIRGAGELRVKESDRIAAVVTALRALGADAEELEDGMVVRGSRRALRGRVVTHGDHRIAMAFGVLGAATGGGVEVDDPACVSVSYPGFWRDLAAVTA